MDRRRPGKTPRRIDHGKLRRGLRTPKDVFRGPLSEGLAEPGGSAHVGRVLALVHDKTCEVLHKCDCRPLSFAPNLPRWRNTARWCRNTLVREGLMKSDSSHGVWEISERGTREVAG